MFEKFGFRLLSIVLILLTIGTGVAGILSKYVIKDNAMVEYIHYGGGAILILLSIFLFWLTTPKSKK
ncbi:MAG: hypothetical protein QW728_05970 [Thermoplasmata archaeon]